METEGSESRFGRQTEYWLFAGLVSPMRTQPDRCSTIWIPCCRLPAERMLQDRARPQAERHNRNIVLRQRGIRICNWGRSLRVNSIRQGPRGVKHDGKEFVKYLARLGASHD